MQLLLTMISVIVCLCSSLILGTSWRQPFCSFNGSITMGNVLYHVITDPVNQPRHTFTISCSRKGRCSIWAAGQMEEGGGPHV